MAVIPVAREQAAGFGILKVDARGRIVHFEEKPGPERLDDARVRRSPASGRGFLASMGIYLFDAGRSGEVRSPTPRWSTSAGTSSRRPSARRGCRPTSSAATGRTWGRSRSYFEANLALTDPSRPLTSTTRTAPSTRRPRFLPATKLEGCTLHAALVSEGCILMGAEIERSVIGIRSRIGQGTRLQDTLMLGADFYETLEEIERAQTRGVPPVGIGADRRSSAPSSTRTRASARRPDPQRGRAQQADGAATTSARAS